MHNATFNDSIESCENLIFYDSMDNYLTGAITF